MPEWYVKRANAISFFFGQTSDAWWPEGPLTTLKRILEEDREGHKYVNSRGQETIAYSSSEERLETDEC